MSRPSNERDGPCTCDYNPDTTDGPEEDCPFHGRPYAYWIERGDVLQQRADAVLAWCDQQDRITKGETHITATIRRLLSAAETGGEE